MKNLIYLFISCAIWTTAHATEEGSVEGLPQALWESANKNDCKSLQGFYSKTETYNPPYVFNLLKDQIFSAAYICDYENKKIVIWQKDDQWVKAKPFTCPKVITTDRFDMGGMSVEHKQVNFSQLYDLNQKRKVWVKGPDVIEVTFLIRINYDGLNSVLACHNGKWYFNNYD